MCFSSLNNKRKIATKDIPVFKIAKVFRGAVRPYFITSSLCYNEGVTYANKRPFRFYKPNDDKKYEVHEAIHSYSTENIRLTTDDTPYDYIRIYTHRTTPEAHDVLTHYSQRYSVKTNYTAIMLCTIPKGTKYAVNEVGEIVSDAIKVEKIIKNPFTVNKDNRLSKRSVERVNKILNDWENEKL